MQACVMLAKLFHGVIYTVVLFSAQFYNFNPSLTARVKKQNVDILATVYLVHLKVEHCQIVFVLSTGQNESTVFDW